jgi:hypothetical protein
MSGPRPIYVTIVPYSELPEYNLSVLPNFGDARIRAIRYYKRLLGVHAELLTILNDFRRDRDAEGVKKDNSYFFWYEHQRRKEDLLKVGENLRNEMDLVSKLIGVLESPDCAPKEDQEKRFDAVIDGKFEDIHFDDFNYWILLPLPSNVIPATVKKDVSNLNADKQERAYKYERYLFRHWVDRQARVRCALFLECLTKEDEDRYHDEIIKTFDFPHDEAIAQIISNETNANTKLVGIAPQHKLNLTSSPDDTRLSQFDIYIRDEPSDQWTEHVSMEGARK